MGQKVNPIGLRLKINRTWDSIWFAPTKEKYRKTLQEDLAIREEVQKKYGKGAIAKIAIEYYSSKILVKLHTTKPGYVIGQRGSNIEALKARLNEICSLPVDVRIVEVEEPNLSAQILAEQIAVQIEERMPYKRLMKQAVRSAIRAGAKGIRVQVKGRLNGAEIARKEWYMEGRVPLQTLRAKIDYGFAEALTKYGKIGVKVWIYLGDELRPSLFSIEKSEEE